MDRSVNWDIDVARGLYSDYKIIHKFGHNHEVGTSFVPIASLGVYRTPQVSAATTLRIKAGGDANDTAAGSGAREVTFYGIDETGAEVEEAVATNGALASSPTTTTFIRLFRARVTASGTYASATAGSHAATITIENGTGTEDWAEIPFHTSGFPESTTQIAAYTVPNGWTAFIKSAEISVDSNKVADILGFSRTGVLQTAAPYDAMRVFVEYGAAVGTIQIKPVVPYGPFPANTDFGFMGKVSATTGEIDIDIEIILIREAYEKIRTID